MIEFNCANIDIYNGSLIINIPKGIALDIISEAKRERKLLHVAIDYFKEKKHRSLSANAFCWALCQKIAVEMSKNGPVVRKEDVYRQEIKELFAPQIMEIPNEEVATWREVWSSRGVGWMCEDLGESTLYGRTRVGFYVGSSRFDTEKMSRLIDGLVQDAEALGIDVMSEADRQLILSHWEKDRKKED